LSSIRASDNFEFKLARGAGASAGASATAAKTAGTEGEVLVLVLVFRASPYNSSRVHNSSRVNCWRLASNFKLSFDKDI